jgi:hypothetical protein
MSRSGVGFEVERVFDMRVETPPDGVKPALPALRAPDRPS